MPASKELFEKYLNPVWIETGSYHGDGIQQAIDAGFKSIYSIELGFELYQRCCARFRDIPNVILIHGDSHLIMDDLLSTINKPMTFWLDGHFSGGDTVIGKYNSPLMQELDCIGRHFIKTHTIMIDDLRIWQKGSHGFDVPMLKEKLLLINPDYKLILEEGLIPDDILVAKT
jgi:hypothetical protein